MRVLTLSLYKRTTANRTLIDYIRQSFVPSIHRRLTRVMVSLNDSIDKNSRPVPNEFEECYHTLENTKVFLLFLLQF